MFQLPSNKFCLCPTMSSFELHPHLLNCKEEELLTCTQAADRLFSENKCFCLTVGVLWLTSRVAVVSCCFSVSQACITKCFTNNLKMIRQCHAVSLCISLQCLPTLSLFQSQQEQERSQDVAHTPAAPCNNITVKNLRQEGFVISPTSPGPTPLFDDL